MSEHIHKRHNKTLLLYHMVFPVKYRRKAISNNVEQTIIEVGIGIGERYEIYFVEIGADENHIHLILSHESLFHPKSRKFIPNLRTG